ncbi:hypothetical protein PISL3812_07975 [Talaromyces islandicus]|uniref:Uncharacterized protein n=1 Tax=Talaromyces islandicus TaxID=28573 RepID=A0A0U1M5P7_TALIS|nr:hypothetical protein PISL3812_07975 [Talaromyces islandicus]
MSGSPRDAVKPSAGSEIKYKTISWSDTIQRMKNKEDDLLRKGRPSPFPDHRDPPVIAENVVDLNDLDEPTEGFSEHYNWLRTIKYPNATEGFWLLKFHFWGINQHYPGNHATRAKTFIKLFYNMDPKYRITTKDEFENTNLDAGPRLLKREILQKLGKAPISRHYPEVPQGCDASEQQRLAPAKQSLAQEKEAQEAAQVREVPVPEQIPENLNHIRETLERLLVERRYKNLQVHPSKQRDQPLATVLKGSFNVDHTFTQNEQGIRYSLWGYGPVAAEGDGGMEAACDCIIMAGKFLDAGITIVDVQGDRQITYTHQLLDNAVTIKWGSPGDPANPQAETFHRYCLAQNSQNLCDLVEYSTLLRRQFLITSEEAEFCEDGHKRVIHRTFCRYKKLPENSEEEHSEQVNLSSLLGETFGLVPPECSPLAESTQESLPGSSVRRDPKDSRPRCSVERCGRRVCDPRVCHTMPLRLAIYPSQSMVPQNHTSDDIRFNITNSKGKQETVIYRWLGGIYSNSKRFDGPDTRHRVYWTETVRGEKQVSGIRMYDPFQHGWCIRGINPARDGSLIPREWQPSMIFYEIVLNPDPLDITVAAGVLGDIGHAVHIGQPILQAHGPWNSSKENHDPGDGPTGSEAYNGRQFDAEFALPTSGAFGDGNTTEFTGMSYFSEFNTETDTVLRALSQANSDFLMASDDLIDASHGSSDLVTANQLNNSNTNGFPTHNGTYTHQNVPPFPRQPPFVAPPSAPLAGQYFSSGTSNGNGVGGTCRTAQAVYNNPFAVPTPGINRGPPGLPQMPNGTRNDNLENIFKFHGCSGEPFSNRGGQWSVPNVGLYRGSSSRKRTWEDDNDRGNKRPR